jgi:Holliday junction resolvase RusA-like endonuclease
MGDVPPTISFFAPGIPAPGGSKKAFVIPGTNRARVVEDAKRNAPWRAVVSLAAETVIHTNTFGCIFPLTGPLAVRFVFTFPRPRCHFGTGRNADKLKPSAPRFPAVKPDTTKVIRSTEDALTGILWVDDARIVEQRGRKVYGDRPGALVEVWILPETLG